MNLFVLFGSYCENAIVKREPFRDEHLSRLSKLKEVGLLKTLGPTKCNKYVFGIFEASTSDEVRKILEEDIYWKEGIWTSLDLYPWSQAF